MVSQGQLRDPESHPPAWIRIRIFQIRHHTPGRRDGGKMNELTHLDIEKRCRALIRVLPQLHDPPVFGERCRKMQHKVARAASTSRALPVECCVDGRACIYHDHVVRSQEIREVEEARVGDGVVARARYYHAPCTSRLPASKGARCIRTRASTAPSARA